MRISVIMCYTSIKLKDKLIESLKTQTEKDYEIIAIDNSSKKFSSCASALNYAAQKAVGENLIFVHQDIIFEQETALEEIASFLDYNKDSLVGVAGVKANHQFCSNITETENKIIRYSNVINEPQEVETIDECLIAIRKELFDKIRFDDKTCDNWHFYGVDMSYQVFLRGGKVYCLPIRLNHLSTGKLSVDFFKGLLKLVKKYKGQLDYINSTCVYVRCNVVVAEIYSFIKIIKMKIKKFLKRK